MIRKLRFPIVFAAVLLVALTAFGSFRQRVASASPEQQDNVLHSYSVKFVCGKQGVDNPDLAVTRVGVYATDINIHNYNLNQEAPIRKEVIVLVANGQPVGREPNVSRPSAFDSIVLPPDHATMDDCSRIWRLLGAAPGSYFVGFLRLLSQTDLNVVAVYTVNGLGTTSNATNTDIDVERVEGQLIIQ